MFLFTCLGLFLFNCCKLAATWSFPFQFQQCDWWLWKGIMHNFWLSCGLVSLFCDFLCHWHSRKLFNTEVSRPSGKVSITLTLKMEEQWQTLHFSTQHCSIPDIVGFAFLSCHGKSGYLLFFNWSTLGQTCKCNKLFKCCLFSRAQSISIQAMHGTSTSCGCRSDSFRKMCHLKSIVFSWFNWQCALDLAELSEQSSSKGNRESTWPITQQWCRWQAGVKGWLKARTLLWTWNNRWSDVRDTLIHMHRLLASSS